MSPEEIRAGIARNEAWWKDHGPFVLESSVQREREINYRSLYDRDTTVFNRELGCDIDIGLNYREREKLANSMARAYAARSGLDRCRPPTHKAASFVGGELRYVGNRFAKIGDSFDGELPAYVPDPETEERKRARETAEAEFSAHAEAETGMRMSDAEYVKKRSAEKLIRTQSEEIANRLKAAGVPAYRADEYALCIYWIHSKTVERLPSYRRICLNPYVAAMVRAPKLAALEFFLQRWKYARFWTFTTGARCTVDEIPERLDWLFKQLRGLNKLLRSYGLEMVFRTTEFGTLEGEELPDGQVMRFGEENSGALERDEAGNVLYHPHAHVVLVSKVGFIKPEKWSEIIKMVHAFWWRKRMALRPSKRTPGTFLKRRQAVYEKVSWLADGVIRNPRECCKYVTKPGDVLKLDAAELKGFFEATTGRRLVRPMGVLAAEIRARAEAGKTLRRKRVGKALQWAEVENHNRLNIETEAEKAARENLEDAYAMTEECKRLAAVEPPSVPGWLDGGAVARRARDPAVTRVMARIGPAAGPTPIKECRVLVLTNQIRKDGTLTLDMREVNAHPLVARLWSQTVHAWEAGRALEESERPSLAFGAGNDGDPIKVHTGTLTGKTADSILAWEREVLGKARTLEAELAGSAT